MTALKNGDKVKLVNKNNWHEDFFDVEVGKEGVVCCSGPHSLHVKWDGFAKTHNTLARAENLELVEEEGEENDSSESSDEGPISKMARLVQALGKARSEIKVSAVTGVPSIDAEVAALLKTMNKIETNITFAGVMTVMTLNTMN